MGNNPLEWVLKSLICDDGAICEGQNESFQVFFLGFRQVKRI